jgi:hypothetical protein
MSIRLSHIAVWRLFGLTVFYKKFPFLWLWLFAKLIWIFESLQLKNIILYVLNNDFLTHTILFSRRWKITSTYYKIHRKSTLKGPPITHSYSSAHNSYLVIHTVIRSYLILIVVFPTQRREIITFTRNVTFVKTYELL